MHYNEEKDSCDKNTYFEIEEEINEFKDDNYGKEEEEFLQEAEKETFEESENKNEEEKDDILESEKNEKTDNFQNRFF